MEQMHVMKERYEQRYANSLKIDAVVVCLMKDSRNACSGHALGVI